MEGKADGATSLFGAAKDSAREGRRDQVHRWMGGLIEHLWNLGGEVDM